LVYVEERLGERDLEGLYSEDYFYYKDYFSNSYNLECPPSKIRKEKLEREIRQMMEMPLFLNLDRHRFKNTLLEVGCAEGIFLEAARRKSWKVAGVEISQWASKFAREKLNLQVFTGSLDQTHFSENYFDVIYMNHVIEHLDNPVKVLCTSWRILRPGGVIVINTPNFNGFSRLILKEEWRAISPERHLYYFTPGTLSKILVKSGFKIDKIVTHGLEPYPIMERCLQKIRFISKKKNLHAVREENRRFNECVRQSKFFPLLKPIINNVLKIIRMGDTIFAIAKKGDMEE